MPRANRYILDGRLAHVTHRCHDSSFLLNTEDLRNEYRERLRLLLKEFKTTLLAFSITCNHVHLLFNPASVDDLARLMQRSQGEFAEWFNYVKGRSGAFWSDRYHATMIQSDDHLWHCLRYIDLNMVRAGVVQHPSEWDWCGFGELSGKRKRFRLIDMEWWLNWSGAKSLEDFHKNYLQWISTALERKESLSREPWWSESVAVGDKDFVLQFDGVFSNRVKFRIEENTSGTWSIHEPETPYNP